MDQRNTELGRRRSETKRAEVASWRANYPLEVDSILSRSALGSVRAVGRILKLATKDPRIVRSVRELKHERGETYKGASHGEQFREATA